MKEQWRDSLIKSAEVKWSRKVKATNIEDGKMDIDIHLPLTDLFEGQARKSYLCGVVDTLAFISDKIKSNEVIGRQTVADMLIEFGYPKEAAKFLENGRGE